MSTNAKFPSDTGTDTGAAVARPNDLEPRLRREVAACTLMLNDLGILGYSGHVSCRLPDGEHFLIQSYSQSRAELTPDKLMISDLDGNALSGPEGERLPAEVFLHSEILRKRPDVMAVAHFHNDRATVFTLVDGVPLVPVKNHAVRWASGIPVHDDPCHVNSPERGRAAADTLGEHNALLIRAHGQVVVAESLPALLVDCVHFVENADAMYAASVLGRVRPLSEDDVRLFRQDLKRESHVSKLWRYYVGRGKSSGVLDSGWEL